MKRFVFLVFVLTAGLVAAESKPFNFNMGADTEYLGLFNNLETDASGSLEDNTISMNFVGGHIFADISNFVTVSAGAWYGLPGAKIDSNGTTSSPANTMLLLDLSGILKYPIAVGDSFVFAPKFGIDAMYYLAGNFDGSSPSTTLKTAVSPFSFIMGADADYTFPSGVFLRLPIDVSYALNSRPASLSGGYIGSHTLTLRTGIAVGYKLLGFDRSNAPAPAPAAPAAPAEPAAAEAPAPAKPRFAVGGGTTGVVLLKNQTQTLSGTEVRIDQLMSNIGVCGFADITDYLSISLGFERGAGDATGAVNEVPLSNAANALLFFEFGAEVKYPFALTSGISLAPKLGIIDSIVIGGTINSATLSTAAQKQWYSPVSVTLGADLNLEQANNLFVRIPLDVGLALNTRLPSSYYSDLSSKYKSSYTLVFHSGVSVGYRL